ncbi:hypothetical protein OAF63_01330 [Saprospiraceae bacterium]|jgi:hypothetical protein|nr:hypothetical protein [Bacteroidota bacterium]MDB4727405.1 hypothetical protein [Saprospiraceae bacterium]MDF1866180.1 hypothetical protein [Saprospiraceae bacterium]
MSNYWNKNFTLLCFLIFGAATSFAQPKDNAPYSRFGLGDPLNQFFSSAAGMGGLSATYADPFHVNFLNPASLGHLASATFEVGVFGENSTLESNDLSQEIWSGNLNYISLGFPLQNNLNAVLNRKVKPVKWGMNIALLPYTNVDYEVQTEGPHPVNDTLDVLNIFEGNGGTNRLIWSNGWKYKNFSGGINMGLIFGKLEKDRSAIFQNLDASYDDRFTDDISVSGFVWSVGAQYQLLLNKEEYEKSKNLGDKKSLIFGLYGNSKTGFKTTNDRLAIGINSRLGSLGVDTLVNEQIISKDNKLPAEFTAGVMYEHIGKLRVGFEYSIGKWSGYVNEATGEGTPDGIQFSDSQRISAGLEWIPDATSYNSFLKRVRYRFGAYYHDDPRLEDLKNTGISFGLGLPIVLPRQQTSFVNIAFEYGKFGISDSIEEKYFRTTIGFTLNDNSWFFKRKFN